jgi:transporter family-2 protein
LIFGVLGALFTGLAITLQSTITSRAGALIGDTRTGLWTNFLGGLLAGVFLLFSLSRQGFIAWKIPPNLIALISVSGFLGIIIISGISFSLQRTGVAAGLATIILGQLAFSVLIDHLGIGAAGAIPFSVQRFLGLCVFGVGVYLLLPRT